MPKAKSDPLTELCTELDRLALAGDREGIKRMIRQLEKTGYRNTLVLKAARDWLKSEAGDASRPKRR